jgi:putative ABC transport system ATP-binding protein
VPIATSAILLTGHQLGEGAVPVVLGLAIDDAVAQNDPAHLALWVAMLALAFATLSLSWRFGARAGARVRLGIAHELRLGLAAAVFDGRAPDNSGAVLTLAVSDARRVGESVRAAVGSVAALVLVLASMAAIARVSALLAALVLLGAAAMLAVAWLLSRPIEARSRAEQEAQASAAASAVDLIAGLRVLAGLRAGRAAAARYRGVSREAVRHATRAAGAEAAVDGLAGLLALAYLLAVAAGAAFAAARGAVSIGDLIAVLGLSQLLIDPLRGLAGVGPALRRGRASARRIDAVLGAPRPEPGTLEPARRGVPELVLDRVAAPGLDDVTLRVPPGALLGVAAPDPVAAESLLALLGGELRPAAGRVLVDGVELGQLAPAAARERVLAWPHGAFPIGATAAEVLGGADAPRRPVLSATVADDVLDRLPGGAAAPIDERGASLSGGERQRLALARLLAVDPPALVLHEPASALDAVTETAVADGIRTLRRGRTTVLVSTSPALLGRCDRVAFLVDGAIRAEGAHAELLARADYRAAVGR